MQAATGDDLLPANELETVEAGGMNNNAIPVKTMAAAAAEVEAAQKNNDSRGKHGYGEPNKYNPATPPQWEIVTRRCDLPIDSLVLKESVEGLTGLKVHGTCFQNGRVRLAVKPRPHNVKSNEILIPLR